jgi:hypothetical protein
MQKAPTPVQSAKSDRQRYGVEWTRLIHGLTLVLAQNFQNDRRTDPHPGNWQAFAR